MEVKSTLKVVNIREIKGAEGVIPEQSMRRLIGSTESNKKMQFTVDKTTKRSYIDLEELAKRDAISFKSHY